MNKQYRQFTIYIRLTYQTPLGKALYIIGNVPQLGNWEISHALRLNWSDTNIWRNSTKIRVKLPYNLQYKYVIGDYQDPMRESLIWENGANRKISVDYKTNQIFLNQRWNMQKISLQLLTQVSQKSSQILVLGNCIQLGLKSVPQFMSCLNTLSLEIGFKKRIWSINFYFEKNKQNLQYFYIKDNWKERRSQRFFAFSGFSPCSDRLMVQYNPGQIVLTDIEHKDFEISQINTNIFIGPSVRNQQDVLQLKKNGINAVLDLQCHYDTFKQHLNEDLLAQIYRDYNISRYKFQIKDRMNRDFINKSKAGIKLLAQLIKNFKIVYVHCTAGIYRSPQLVILYLSYVDKYEIGQAMDLVKSKRNIALPNLKVIESAKKKMEQENIVGKVEKN